MCISLFCLALSCTHDKAGAVVPEKVCNTPENVSFNQDIIPVFNQYCNTSGCHSGGTPGGNLNLEPSLAYSELTNSSSGYVDTINPKYSVLYAQMNSVSNPMPPSGKLDQCKLDLVLKWIQQKAKNN